MAEEYKIKVPDIGGADDVDVIEILVNVGDEISEEDSLLTLESDKASMEIPAPKAGKVKSIDVKVGDKVSEGDVIITLEGEVSNNKEDKASSSDEPKEDEGHQAPENATESAPAKQEHKPKPSQSAIHEVKVPDIGGAANVDVIDIMVSVGDTIGKEDSIITLESDKASMDIPAPEGGTVKDIKIKVGDKISEGDLILTIETTGDETPLVEQAESSPQQPPQSKEEAPSKPVPEAPKVSELVSEVGVEIHAGPAVRRMARELGVDLNLIKSTGRKTRITKEDVQGYVKNKLRQGSGTGGLAVSPAPVIDFTKFGEIDKQPLNKIKRLTGENVHRSWVTIPHVTQFDEADISELEAFRKMEAEKAKQEGYKLTLLAFVCKAVMKALMAYPQFNAPLSANGEELLYKKYYNVGVAVDTPNGLVVPVIKGVDTLTISGIAKEMARLSTKAREKGLMPNEMSGGCFTISSLGGIGGTAFTPIVNSPEVAILGLSRSAMKPIYQKDGTFEPRLMLPISLSYDHRVIDGAEAARFARHLCESLGDIRKILL